MDTHGNSHSEQYKPIWDAALTKIIKSNTD